MKKKQKRRLKYSFYEIVNFLDQFDIDDEDFESSMGEGEFEGVEVTETKHTIYNVYDRLYVISLHSDYLDKSKSYKQLVILNKVNSIRDVRIRLDLKNNVKEYNIKKLIALKDVIRHYNVIYLEKKLERELKKKDATTKKSKKKI